MNHQDSSPGFAAVSPAGAEGCAVRLRRTPPVCHWPSPPPWRAAMRVLVAAECQLPAAPSAAAARAQAEAAGAADRLPPHGRFGHVTSCDIIRDFKTGDSLNYGFIGFDTCAGAGLARAGKPVVHSCREPPQSPTAPTRHSPAVHPFFQARPPALLSQRRGCSSFLLTCFPSCFPSSFLPSAATRHARRRTSR